MRVTYNWQMGNCDKFWSDRPVPENAFLFDLLSGAKFLVEAVTPAYPPDIAEPTMRTRPAGFLGEDQLTKLRQRAGSSPNDFCLPLDNLVFFTDSTELQALFG